MRGAEHVRQQFRVEGLHCPSCASRIENRLRALPGVRGARVHFAAGRVAVTYDPGMIDLPDVAAVLESLGHAVHPGGDRCSSTGAAPLDGCPPVSDERERGQVGGSSFPSGMEGRAILFSRWLPTLVVAAGLIAGTLLQRVEAAPAVWRLVFSLSLLVGGWPIACAAVRALRTRHTTDIHFLLVVAVLGAAALGEWLEAGTVLILFSIAEVLEGHSVARAQEAIRALVQLAPPTARVRRGVEELLLPVDEVAAGDVLVLRPGDRVPLDAEVIAGASTVNEAAITGESLPTEKGPGDAVYAGTFNERGWLEARVVRPASQSTLARIIQLVEEAQAQRSPTERFIDRFARVYTPAILAVALLIAVLPPLLGLAWGDWIYRALTLLIIACPCALVISTPVAVACALTRAARSGVLIRGGGALEMLAALKGLAFDKTGTLTHGHARMTQILPADGLDAAELLRLAAGVEHASEHPIARAILERAREEGLSLPRAERFEALPGRGARAVIEGQTVVVGKPGLFDAAPPALEEATRRLQVQGQSVVWVGVEDGGGRPVPIGALAIADTARATAAEALRSLRRLGIARIEMLTGDHPATARAIANSLGVDAYHAELLPQQKVERVRALRASVGPVGMVGDGINDAPALASASVGIAMGVAGTDVALETADVTLMGDELTRLPLAMALSRRATRIVQANIAFSLLVKAGFLALTLAGLGSLWLAVVADTGCSLVVVANSLRLLAPPRLPRTDEQPTAKIAPTVPVGT